MGYNTLGESMNMDQLDSSLLYFSVKMPIFFCNKFEQSEDNLKAI